MSEGAADQGELAITLALDGLRNLVRAGQALDRLTDETIQDLFAVIVKLHFLARENGRCETPFPVSGDGDSVTATEAAVAASAIVAALNIELFELAMWQTSSSL